MIVFWFLVRRAELYFRTLAFILLLDFLFSFVQLALPTRLALLTRLAQVSSPLLYFLLPFVRLALQFDVIGLFQTESLYRPKFEEFPFPLVFYCTPKSPLFTLDYSIYRLVFFHSKRFSPFQLQVTLAILFKVLSFSSALLFLTQLIQF